MSSTRPPLSERRRKYLAAVADSVYAARHVGLPIQCPICLGVKRSAFADCNNCSQFLGPGVPATYSTIVVKHSPWYNVFVRYKQLAAERSDILAMASALSGGMEARLPMLIDVLGGPPTVVAPVPSTKPGVTFDQQPLTKVICTANPLAGTTSPALIKVPSIQRERRTYQPEIFEPVPGLASERVLLIEDLITGGSTVASALRALTKAGIRAAALVLGRVVHASGPFDATPIINQLGKPEWWDG